MNHSTPPKPRGLSALISGSSSKGSNGRDSNGATVAELPDIPEPIPGLSDSALVGVDEEIRLERSPDEGLAELADRLTPIRQTLTLVRDALPDEAPQRGALTLALRELERIASGQR